MAKDIKRHISHLKSSGTTAPAAADLVYGEIAVGYKVGEEKLYIKNSDGNVISFENTANVLAVAELYADSGDVTSVSGDSEISVTLSDKAASGRTLTVTHASGSAQSGFNKLASDSYGHITGGTAVTLSDLTGLGAVSSARTITTASGLTGGGNLSANRTIGLEATGTSGTYVKVKTDAYGRVTSGATTIAESDVTNLTTDLAAKVGTARTITTASGLTGGGNLSSDLTIGHSNNITAGTAKTSSTSVTATPSGSNIAIPNIVYDSNGHITSTGSTNVSLKVNSATSSTAGVVKIDTATGSNNTDTVMTQKAVTDELATKALASSAITSADYDSNNKLITFKNAAGTQVDSIDATDFIKDGMVDNAEISGSSLVITFNTDAGKEPIAIPLTDIFNPNNYYQKSETSGKTEISTALAAKANTAITVTGTGVLGGGGNLSQNRTITHNNNGTLGSGTTSPNTAQTPAFNATFDIPVLSYDEYGHITGSTTTTVKIPASASTWTQNYYVTGATTTTAASKFDVSLTGNNTSAKASFTIPSATTTAAGVMTAADKTKLNGIADGATNVTESTVEGWGFTKNTGTVTKVTLGAGMASSGTDITTTGTVKCALSSETKSSLSAASMGTIANRQYAVGLDANGVLSVNVPWSNTNTAYTTSAFTTVSVVGASTVNVVADQKHDTITFDKDDAIKLTGDATNDKVTFGLGDIVCGDYA